MNFRSEKKIFIEYTEEFNQYLMLLSDRQRIVKTMNSDFKDEENHDFSSCKSDNNMQLKKVIKSDNFDNLDFDDESSSSNNENKNENESENVDENEILSLSSSNSLTSETVFASALAFTSTNSTVKDRQKQIQKPAIIISIIKDKQISKLSTQEKEYAASKNFFKSRK